MKYDCVECVLWCPGDLHVDSLPLVFQVFYSQSGGGGELVLTDDVDVLHAHRNRTHCHKTQYMCECVLSIMTLYWCFRRLQTYFKTVDAKCLIKETQLAI